MCSDYTDGPCPDSNRMRDRRGCYCRRSDPSGPVGRAERPPDDTTCVPGHTAASAACRFAVSSGWSVRNAVVTRWFGCNRLSERRGLFTRSLWIGAIQAEVNGHRAAARVGRLCEQKVRGRPRLTSPNVVNWLHLWFVNVTKITRNMLVLLGNMEPASGLEPPTC
jgi:hypothetical protein